MLITTAPSRSAPGLAVDPAATIGPAEVPLRVVTDDDLRDAWRRILARRLAAALTAAVAVALFGVVIAHVLLMQGQFELQRLEERSAASQEEFDRLRLQVSELESPDRIVAAAQERLGMVAPEKVTYLAPSADPNARPVPSPAARFTRSTDPRAAEPVRWASVKSQLAGG